MIFKNYNHFRHLYKYCVEILLNQIFFNFKYHYYDNMKLIYSNTSIIKL